MLVVTILHVLELFASHVQQPLTELLDELLVLVQLLQRLAVHARDVVGLGLVAMLLISEDANGELGSRDVLEPTNCRIVSNQWLWGVLRVSFRFFFELFFLVLFC